MPRPVGNKFNEISPCNAPREPPGKFVHHIANSFRHGKIRSLGGTTNCIGFAYASVLQNTTESTRMVFNIKPITDILPVTVDGNRLTFDALQDR